MLSAPSGRETNSLNQLLTPKSSSPRESRSALQTAGTTSRATAHKYIRVSGFESPAEEVGMKRKSHPSSFAICSCCADEQVAIQRTL